MKDRQNREIEYMRISLTDRCNLRCRYCMPNVLPFVPHEQILRYEEILAICECAVELGIDRFKITGGEPLLRKGVLSFMERLKKLPGCRQVTVTTNGVLLKQSVPQLQKIGIDGINVSLDTLDRKTYEALTGSDSLNAVLEGLYQAVDAGLKVKINCVPLKGINETDWMDLLEICRNYPVDVRFIELMPIGNAKSYAGVSLKEMEHRIRECFPDGEDVKERLGNGPARYYHPVHFQGSIGFIDALQGKFCSRCNRVRLTSEGFLKTCLYYDQGISLRDPLRNGCSSEELTNLIRQAVLEKPKEHQFDRQKSETDADTRNMSQIGG